MTPSEQLAYSRGRREGIEAAAKVCDERRRLCAMFAARAEAKSEFVEAEFWRERVKEANECSVLIRALLAPEATDRGREQEAPRAALPSQERVAVAAAEIRAEDEAAERVLHTPEYDAIVAENSRRSRLPSEHPDHIHGMGCDGQDGDGSFCERLRRKLFSVRAG